MNFLLRTFQELLNILQEKSWALVISQVSHDQPLFLCPHSLCSHVILSAPLSALFPVSICPRNRGFPQAREQFHASFPLTVPGTVINRVCTKSVFLLKFRNGWSQISPHHSGMGRAATVNTFLSVADIVGLLPLRFALSVPIEMTQISSQWAQGYLVELGFFANGKKIRAGVHWRCVAESSECLRHPCSGGAAPRLLEKRVSRIQALGNGVSGLDFRRTLPGMDRMAVFFFPFLSSLFLSFPLFSLSLFFSWKYVLR